MWRFVVILNLLILSFLINKGKGSDDCPPLPSDCKPECVVFDQPHCRKCDCSAAANYGMTFGNDGQGKSGGSNGSPFNQGTDLSKTPFSSSIAAMGNSLGGGGMGEVSGIGNGGMRNGLMSVPGMFLHGPSSGGRVACLRDDIICPSYCLVIDEYGCKSCPCGPASGMGMAMISHGHSNQGTYQEKPKESNNQCLATLVCMLSCDDGYKLGPKGQDGCQTCECTKHKNEESKGSGDNNTPQQTGQNENNKNGNGQIQQTGQTGSGNSEKSSGNSDKSDKKESNSSGNSNENGGQSSGGGGQGGSAGSGQGSGFNPMFAGSGMGDGMGSMGGSGCSGPFCASSTTGGKSIKGPFDMPGMNNNGGGITANNGDHCIGPSCSAPGNHNPGNIAQVSSQTSSCPSTDLCVKTCKYTVKLGPKMADGCPSCACEKSAVMTTEAPKQKLCDDVVKCMISCKSGYRLKSGKEGGCPLCECDEPTPAPTVDSMKNVLSCTETTIKCMQSCKNGYHMQGSVSSDCPVCNCLPPPTEEPKAKPNIYSIMRNCPETVHCMTTCRNGYSLEGGASECPRCSCNQAQVVTLTCQTSLSCPRGCQLGYKCGDDGCPTCSCIEAQEIGVAHSVTYIQAALTCNAQFSCVSKCEFGYKTGENGCPTCRCLQPLAVTHQLTLQEKCPDSYRCSSMCPNGYFLKTEAGNECPLCECATVITGVTSNTHLTGSGSASCNGPECSAHNGVHSGNSVAVFHPSTMTYEQFSSLCPETVKCIKSCANGYTTTTGSESCPICKCKELTTNSPKVIVVAPTESVLTCVGPDCSGNGKEPHQLSMKERCPETFRCNDICQHGFSLRTVDGKACPVCECATALTEVKTGTTDISHVHQTGSSNGQVVVLQSHTGGSSTGVIPVKTGTTDISHGQQTGSSNEHGLLQSHTGSLSTGSSSHNAVVGHSAITGNINGENCMGPSCSAKNGLKFVAESKQIEPNQCADILTCVVSCKHGYKLGPKGSDGCPTCNCLK